MAKAKSKKAPPAKKRASPRPSSKPRASRSRAGKRPRARFRVGQMIVYPFHGVGRIVGFERNDIAGEKKWYYAIDFRDGELTVRLPIERDREIAIRPVISSREADAVLKVLKGRKEKEETDWKARFAAYNEKLKTGDVHAAAEVMRNLSKRGPEGELSMSEKRLLDASTQLVIHEIAVAKKKTVEEVEAEIQLFLKRKLLKVAGEEEDV